MGVAQSRAESAQEAAVSLEATAAEATPHATASSSSQSNLSAAAAAEQGRSSDEMTSQSFSEAGPSSSSDRKRKRPTPQDNTGEEEGRPKRRRVDAAGNSSSSATSAIRSTVTSLASSSDISSTPDGAAGQRAEDVEMASSASGQARARSLRSRIGGRARDVLSFLCGRRSAAPSTSSLSSITQSVFPHVAAQASGQSMDVDATPAESSSSAAVQRPRELSPDELAAERLRAVQQISSVLGSSGVRRRSRHEDSDATTATGSTQANASTAANQTAPVDTAPSVAAGRRIPQLLNDLLGMAPAHGRGGAARGDSRPGNANAMLPGRMSLSAGTYVVVQGMLVARGPPSASHAQSQNSNASAAEASSSTASISQAEAPQTSPSATTGPRATRSRRRSFSDLDRSEETSAFPPFGEHQRASDSQASSSQPAQASSSASNSEHSVHHTPSGMTEMRGQLAVSPPSSPSEQSAMLTRMIAIATAATAVSLMNPASSQRQGGAQPTAPPGAPDAQSAQDQSTGPSHTGASSSDPPATEGQGNTAPSDDANNGAQAPRPDSLATDLPSMLSNVLSARAGSADHAFTPLSSDPSAATCEDSDRPAWTPATLNETLSRVRNGTVTDGPVHTFDHFLHALSQDLHAAIQNAYGPVETPQDSAVTERRQRDVTEGNVSFFRMFRFGQPAEATSADAGSSAPQSSPSSSSTYPAWLNSHSRAQRREQEAQQEQLQPCLVVGIRSRAMEQNSPFIFPQPPAPAPAASDTQESSSSSTRPGETSNSTTDATSSAASETGDTEEQGAADAPIRYSLFISGGYYAADHPLLSNPIHVAARDLMMLMETLAAFTAFQPRRNVATTEDIKKSDLRTVAGKDLAELIAQDDVAENTVDKCLICLEDWQPEDQVRILSCKHAYHVHCVDRWLVSSSNSCPLCRREAVKTASPATGTQQANPTASL